MKRLILSISLLIFLTGNSYSQKVYSSIADVYNTREIIFYGYDFSHFKLADAKRIGQDINKFIVEWTEFCKEKINEKKLSSWLHKREVIFNFDPAAALNSKLVSEELVSAAKHTFPKDSIQAYVNNYNITEKEGVGFVVILECMNSDSKATSLYFTFFDIATRKVLLSDYFYSLDGNNYNLASDWGAAINIAFKKYVMLYKNKNKFYTSVKR